MAWLLFVVSAAIITFAAVQLAKYGDVIAKADVITQLNRLGRPA